ncbi:hypothetical protein BGZ99_007416 [Dissophora globulifera]|uniref:SET domain-containing protein n=1 Tax=Dissophora globulifera TaxID=979702 RepID=A0A9P6R9R6_9FUNG|nr:hypothetical protein BGZ99_007416 [Dissophora globulifera]
MSTALPHFRAWATEHGVVSALVPKESKGMGTGLFLPQDQDQPQSDSPNSQQGELLYVPRSLLLCRTRILSMQIEPLQRTFDAIGLDNVTERLAVLLFLLYQRLVLEERDSACRAGLYGLCKPVDPSAPGSIFDPYIATLPDVSTPVTLDPDMVQGYLAGTLLLDSVSAKRNKLETEFELLSGNMNVFDGWSVLPSLENFIWADATFWSRVLSFGTQWSQDDDQVQGKSGLKRMDQVTPDDMHMVPFLDFANHATNPNIRWQVDADGLRVWAKESLLDSHRGDGTKDYHRAHDSEVYLSYGNKPNTELLFLYGFTLPDNPTEFLTLPLPMDEEDPYYMPKAHTLMRLGIPPRVTIYLSKQDGPKDLVELCQGLWITPESQFLLWIYSLNEEDGVGALIEEPSFKVCLPDDMADGIEDEDGGNGNDLDKMEEADLIDEAAVGRLLLTVGKSRIVSTEILQITVPELEIYPVIILRSLLLMNQRIEFYISRIMETGDKVQRTDDIAIVRAINYQDMPNDEGSKSSLPKASGFPDNSRLGNSNIGECLVPTLLEPDHEHPITRRQLDVEIQISSVVSMMKSYRTEEMDLLVRIGNILGEAQTLCLEKSDFIKEYLVRMQSEEVVV